MSNPNLTTISPFLESAQAVQADSLALFAKYFGSKFSATIDYISIYPENSKVQVELAKEADMFGSVVAQKSGDVYSIHTPTAWEVPKFIRIREPSSDNAQMRGCADFIAEDYDAMRQLIPDTQSIPKEYDGQPYEITELLGSNGIGIYIATVPLTRLMHLT